MPGLSAIFIAAGEDSAIRGIFFAVFIGIWVISIAAGAFAKRKKLPRIPRPWEPPSGRQPGAPGGRPMQRPTVKRPAPLQRQASMRRPTVVQRQAPMQRPGPQAGVGVRRQPPRMPPPRRQMPGPPPLPAQNLSRPLIQPVEQEIVVALVPPEPAMTQAHLPARIRELIGSNYRRAIILSEILSPPVALRPDRNPWD